MAVVEPGAMRIRFLPDAGHMFRGDTLIRLGPRDAVWWDADLFVTTDVLDRAFGVAIRMEWADLSAVVGRSSGLPVVRRARRERRRAILDRPARPVLIQEVQPPEPLADGAVFAWSLNASTREPTESYSLDLGAGAKLWGGSLELRPQAWSVQGRAGSDFQGAWVRAWHQYRWLKQVRVGDVQSNGRRARLLRGAVVTNAPFIRSSEFEVEELVGQVPVGWEVELYDRGRLRGYDEIDAIGEFRVPLQLRYGQNPFELVLYGPGGEVVRQKRTVRVPFSRLPEGQFEYAVGAGGCQLDPCDGLVELDLRYGIERRVTLEAGVDGFFRDVRGSVWQPYAAVSAAVLPALSLSGEAVVNGQVRVAAAYEPHPDLRVDVGHTEFAAAGQEFNGTFLEDRRTEASAFWRPGPLNGSLFFQFVGFRSTGPGARTSIERVAATARFGALRYSLGFRHDGARREGTEGFDRYAFDVSADAVLTGPFDWLRATTARATMTVDGSRGLAALQASVGRRIGHPVRADVGIGWFRGLGYSLEIALSTVSRGPRVGTRNRFTSESRSTGVFFTDGSVVWDPDSRLVRWSNGSDLGRAGVTGIVFLDYNANGTRDQGEPGIGGVPVHVGGWFDETDPDGRFAAWDLFPFETSGIDVDSLGFQDPRMVLPTGLIEVRPTPNSFISVDVPVVLGAEVGGFLVLDGVGVAGAPVVFRDLDTGREITVMTFSDGGFYRTGVPPGEYEITLPERAAETLRVIPWPLHIFVPPGSGDKRFDDLILLLERVDE